MRDIKPAALAAAFLLVLAAPAGAQDAEAQDAGVQEAAEAAQALWEEAFNAGDGAKAAEMVFTEDARLLPPDSPPVEGREAIAAYWQETFDAGCTNMDFGLIEVDMVGDDTMIETGTGTFECSNEQGEPEPLSAKFIHIWEKQADGSWLIAQDIFNNP